MPQITSDVEVAGADVAELLSVNGVASVFTRFGARCEDAAQLGG
jgi:hypothetical protein